MAAVYIVEISARTVFNAARISAQMTAYRYWLMTVGIVPKVPVPMMPPIPSLGMAQIVRTEQKIPLVGMEWLTAPIRG